MEGNNQARAKYLLIIIVWSIVPVLVIYRLLGWYGILVFSVVVNLKKVWQAMIQRNPSYAYILNIQRNACTLALFILLWQITGSYIYPSKPVIFDVQNTTACFETQISWLKIGDLCRIGNADLLRWNGGVWEHWIPPLLRWVPR